MKRKNTDGIVYSTNADFLFESEHEHADVTLPPNQQQLRISTESKGRKGKTVTLVKGYVGTFEDMELLTRELKVKCGTGGTAKDKQIIIQGDFRDKILDYLHEKGYKAKKAGG